MTANKGFKQQVRARASKTGESYTAALQHFRNAVAEERDFAPKPIRVAVAQVDPPTDPADRAALTNAGHLIRSAMDQAHDQGAALIHFGEGANVCTGQANYVQRTT